MSQKTSSARKLKQRQQKLQKWQVHTMAAMGTLVVVGMLVCAYGHAAVSADLYIEGQANIEPTGSFNITYMQEMEPVVCERAPVGTTERLIDKRDGKSYWVAKLADNKCWMTQNLALDLTTEGLTSELTNIDAAMTGAKYEEEVNAEGETIYKWNANSKYPPRDTLVGVPFTSSSSDANDVAAKSSNAGGTYVIAQPTVAAASKKNSTVADYGDVVKDVTGWQPTYVYDPSIGLSYDEETQTYDAHYLLGNWYSSGAAYAGSGIVGASNRTTSSSICPKGWRLPKSPNSGSEFSALLNAYGVASKPTYTNAAGESANVAEAPLYFFRNGGVTDGTKFSNIGYSGNYWSNYMASGHYRRVLNISNTSITKAYETTAHPGRLVRCVAA